MTRGVTNPVTDGRGRIRVLDARVTLEEFYDVTSAAGVLGLTLQSFVKEAIMEKVARGVRCKTPLEGAPGDQSRNEQHARLDALLADVRERHGEDSLYRLLEALVACQ